MTTLITPERIHTASLYPRATLPERIGGVVPILITRYWPRFIGLIQAGTDYSLGQREKVVVIWRRDLAPSATLLKRYKHGEIEWDTFAALYRVEVAPLIPDFRDWCARALRLFPAQANDIVLLCHESDDQFCHRYELRDLVLHGEAMAQEVEGH